MVASPNYIFMVYDGDESGFPAPGSSFPRGPSRSRTSSSRTTRRWASRTTTLSSADAATIRRSSRTGSRPVACSPAPRCPKTPEQQAIWGGTAGEQYDQCYHLACDTIDNLALDALDVNADAIAAAVLTYAYSTETVNGVVGSGYRGTSRSRHRPVRRGPSAVVEATSTPAWSSDPARRGRPTSCPTTAARQPRRPALPEGSGTSGSGPLGASAGRRRGSRSLLAGF